VIRSVTDIEALHAKVLNGAERTAAWLHAFAGSPLELLSALRFQTVGHDPLTGQALNVIEQINQTFTILASLRAVGRLIEMHPEANGFRLALATSSGRDIKSIEPDLVAAESILGNSPGQQPETQQGHCALDIGPSALPLCVLCCAEVHHRPAGSLGNCPRGRGALCRALTFAIRAKPFPKLWSRTYEHRANHVLRACVSAQELDSSTQGPRLFLIAVRPPTITLG